MEHVSDLIASLLEKLFEAEERRLDKTLVELNRLNKEAQNSQADGFFYDGEYHLPRNNRVTIVGAPAPRETLHSSLHAAMNLHLQDRKAVRQERNAIKQILLLLLERCTSNQDIRDALPECIVDCVPNLNRLHRSNDAAWTLRGNARAMRQYEKTLQKMEVYSMVRLIY